MPDWIGWTVGLGTLAGLGLWARRLYTTPAPPRISPQRLRQLLRQQRAREDRR